MMVDINHIPWGCTFQLQSRVILPYWNPSQVWFLHSFPAVICVTACSIGQILDRERRMHVHRKNRVPTLSIDLRCKKLVSVWVQIDSSASTVSLPYASLEELVESKDGQTTCTSKVRQSYRCIKCLWKGEVQRKVENLSTPRQFLMSGGLWGYAFSSSLMASAVNTAVNAWRGAPAGAPGTA